MRTLLPALPCSLLLLAGCVAVPVPPPMAAPAVVGRPVTVPTAPAPLGSDWRDWPLTPGDWRYRSLGDGGSEALFGPPGAARLRLRCVLPARQLLLIRADGKPGAVTLRTTSMTQAMTATATPEGAQFTLGAMDRAVDAMGFSRGRFVLEQSGLPPLVVPAWPELLRVVEDCRS